MIRFFACLCLLSSSAFGVSNPEISTKSAKTQSASASQKNAAVAQHVDPILNSINAYAQQYETSSTPAKSYGQPPQLYVQPYQLHQQQPQSQPQYQFSPQPSYRTEGSSSPRLPSSPTLETNFIPMPPAPQHHPHHQHHQHHQQPHQHIQVQPQAPQPPPPPPPQSAPTPVLMQYLPQPQSQVNDGVQYLQLIPTRPLIVPISPYMSPMAQQAYHGPQIIHQQPQIVDYNAAAAAGRTLIPANEPDAASNIPYGMQAYANSLQNYRSYRFNRDIKPINFPVGMILNMQEYMPSPNDAPKTQLVKGRP